MKRLPWMLLGLVLWGCPQKQSEQPDAGAAPKGPVELSEKEPNDGAARALAISESSIVVASLTSDPKTPDEDWYALVPGSSPQQVDVNVSGIAGADIQLAVLDQDGNRILLVNSNGEGKGERFPNLNVTNKVFVAVSSAKKGSGGAYTLTANFQDVQAGFEAEPNDRAVDATALTLDQPVRGYLAHGADEDWYRVELPQAEGEPAPQPQPVQPQQGQAPSPAPESDFAPTSPTSPSQPEEGQAMADQDAVPQNMQPAQPPPQQEVAAMPEDAGGSADLPSTALRIEVTQVKGARLEVAVLSAAEAPLFEVKAKEDEALTLRNIGVRANDRVVYVVVKSAWSGTGKDARRGFNAEEAYTLNVAIEPAGANAEFEPNDELAKATPLPPSGFREGFLAPTSDQDYFVLRSEEPLLARFELTGVDRVDHQLEVVRRTPEGKEETVLKANDGAIKEPEILNNVACAGECYVKVVSASRKVDGKWVRDFENAQMPYRLNVSTVPDTGAEEREPNATLEQATTLALGHPVRGTIQPRRDVDYYKLDLSGRPVRTPIKAVLLGILKVDLGLYLHRAEPDGKLSLVQTSDRAKGDQPETIRYSAEPGVYVLEVRDSTKRYESNFQDRYQLTVLEGE